MAAWVQQVYSGSRNHLSLAAALVGLDRPISHHALQSAPIPGRVTSLGDFSFSEMVQAQHRQRPSSLDMH